MPFSHNSSPILGLTSLMTFSLASSGDSVNLKFDYSMKAVYCWPFIISVLRRRSTLLLGWSDSFWHQTNIAFQPEVAPGNGEILVCGGFIRLSGVKLSLSAPVPRLYGQWAEQLSDENDRAWCWKCCDKIMCVGWSDTDILAFSDISLLA